ncbi:hypothetical protein SEA_CRICKO_86 [Streptomyces phage CricKo]|nr:hypothetical protein SEA_CRICKO_86 [Streptomyces phage CricKo]QNL30701.1 hypothetical protein SEA_THIQQUMS_86 [Streptomyces phage Thiqqums]
MDKTEENIRRIVREELSKVIDETREKATVPDYVDTERMSDALIAICSTISEKAAKEEVNRHEDYYDVHSNS